MATEEQATEQYLKTRRHPTVAEMEHAIEKALQKARRGDDWRVVLAGVILLSLATSLRIRGLLSQWGYDWVVLLLSGFAALYLAFSLDILRFVAEILRDSKK